MAKLATKASKPIRAAGNGAAKSNRKGTFARFIFLFEPTLAARINQAAAADGLNRTAWVVNACVERLRATGRES